MVHKVFLIFETDMISEFERHKKQFQYSLWCENRFFCGILKYVRHGQEHFRTKKILQFFYGLRRHALLSNGHKNSRLA